MAKQKAVFLDLQGTLGGEGLGDISGFSFFRGSVEAIRRLNHAGFLAIVVTNQSHISKGLLSMADFEQRMLHLQLELAHQGAHFDGVYCCPHTVLDHCSCRKPKPGMLLKACTDFSLDLNHCFLVGDTGAWDMILARDVGCKAVLVRTGLGESSLGEYRSTWKDIDPDFIADDAASAVDWILHQQDD
jgi:D-glycero-D-manno-heptose 1,7-bisphosphate phosphatase